MYILTTIFKHHLHTLFRKWMDICIKALYHYDQNRIQKICSIDPLCAGKMLYGHGGLTTGGLLTQWCACCFVFVFAHDSAPLQTSSRPPYPKKEVLWVRLFAVFDEWVFPPKTQTWIWSSRASMRQAGISSILNVTSDKVPCGGSGVDSGGHLSASLLHKPRTFVFGEKDMQNSLFSPC